MDMKLDDSRRSDNVDDERSSGFAGRGAGIGIGTIVIVVIGYFMGVNPATLLGLLAGDQQNAAPAQTTPLADSANDPQVDFVRAILGETEDVWGSYFQGMGKTYSPPRLVLFSRGVASACGNATSAAGPFYCPGDRRVYIDLSFYRQLATEFGAPGQFAQAYVIAHEVGHHVQNVLGITDKASQLEDRGDRTGAGSVSVRVELQADCFAGVWAEQANRDCRRRPPWGTTRCRSANRVRWCPTASRTVPRHSGSSGSGAASIRGPSITATPSVPARHCDAALHRTRGRSSVRPRELALDVTGEFRQGRVVEQLREVDQSRELAIDAFVDLDQFERAGPDLEQVVVHIHALARQGIFADRLQA
jgi:predicted metalloprotease